MFKWLVGESAGEKAKITGTPIDDKQYSYPNGLKVLGYEKPETVIPTTKIAVSGEYSFSFDPNKEEKRAIKNWGWSSYNPQELPNIGHFVSYIAIDIVYSIDDNQEEYTLKKNIELYYDEEQIEIYRNMVHQIENGAVTIRNKIIDAVRNDYSEKLKEKSLEEMKEIVRNNQTMKIEFTDLVQKISE